VFDLESALDILAAPGAAPAGGSAAAAAGATAAALVTKVARLAGAEGTAAQAIALRARLLRLAPADAQAFSAARAALAAARPEGGDDRRDFSLGQALDLSSAIPLEIAEAAADVAVLAGEQAQTGHPDFRADAEVAALIAAAASTAAARLVEINLALADGDERVARALTAAGVARAAAGSDPR
jgi:formiminotetrahydrofolate cyclodeaminase